MFNWIIDFNIKLGSLNLIEEKVEDGLEYIGTGDKILNRTPLFWTLRSTTNNETEKLLEG